MSAWDLSRGFEQSTQQPTATMPHGPNQIYQLQQHLLAQPANSWQKLTFNEQFHALLASATRAVALETAAAIKTSTINKLTTASTNLIPHLNQIESLNRQLTPCTQQSVLGPVPYAGNPVLDCNISNTLTSRLNLSHANDQFSALNKSKSTGKSSLTSSRSLTPSPSSSRSNSSESVDLSFSKRFAPLVVDNNDDNNSAHYLSSSRASFSSCSSSSASSVNGDSSCEKSTRISVIQQTDKRLRKKDQNRRAAFNYRRKKMEERDKMIEEEARLVHKHVRLAGKIARLEDKILTMLSTKIKRIQNKGGQTMCYLCPVCSDLCDTVTNLRNHLKANHLQLLCMDNCQNLSDKDPGKKVFGRHDDNHRDKNGNHNDGEIHSSFHSSNPERSVVNDNSVTYNIGYNDSNSLV